MSKKQPTEHEEILIALNDLAGLISKLTAAQVVLVRTLVAIFELGEEDEK